MYNCASPTHAMKSPKFPGRNERTGIKKSRLRPHCPESPKEARKEAHETDQDPFPVVKWALT